MTIKTRFQNLVQTINVWVEPDPALADVIRVAPAARAHGAYVAQPTSIYTARQPIAAATRTADLLDAVTGSIRTATNTLRTV